MARYKHLTVKKISLAELRPTPKKRALSPRQLAARQRDKEIVSALNEAATLPASEAVVIEPKAGEKIATLRLAVGRIMAAEPRELNWGVRDGRVVVSKGEIPRRGRRRTR
jgi:hypothetical protein